MKGVVNENNKHFQIKEHLSQKAFAEKKQQSHLIVKNKKLSAAETLKMKVERSKLKVNGEIYEKVIQPPTCRQILKLTVMQLADRMKVDIVQGETVEKEGQKFLSFSAEVKDLEEVNAAYVRV